MTDADGLIEDAERNAQAIVDEARAEVEELAALAARDGESEGASQAQHMREEIAGLLERMLKEVEGEVVRTAMRVAGELLAREMATRDDAVVDVACTALQAAKIARDINLRANPHDAPILRAQKPRLVSVLTRAKDLEIREDKRVKQGGVLIETESGVVDAQLDTQLDELTRALEKPAFGDEGRR
ncbi:MAG TPA: FliH/SctL family protein [Myxococcota bacterium]|jgi:type III secretion protein L